MALIRYGGGIVQMSGSIAGDTFARNRFGNYSRARTKPVNPNTDRQQTIRAALSLLTTRWAQTLTPAQRTAWNSYGSNVAMKNRLGEVVYLTGFNHYIRSNANRVQDSQAIIDAGPALFELPAKDPTMAITASEATQLITITFNAAADWSIEDGAFMFIYQGQPQNAQRNFFGGPWRWIATAPGIDPGGSGSPANLPVAFTIAELQRQWVYCRISRVDGRLSEAFRADCFCAA